MKKSATVLLTFSLMVSSLTACNQGTIDSYQAEQALVDFFMLLNSGKYADADALYGGDYEALISFNPLLNPFAQRSSRKQLRLFRGIQQPGWQPVRTRSLLRSNRDRDAVGIPL
jgi:hypothetical protein